MAHLFINYSHSYNWLVRGRSEEDWRPVAPSSVRSWRMRSALAGGRCWRIVAGRDASGYHGVKEESEMTEALERAFKQAELLSEREQQELAQVIEQALADRRWDDLLNQPASARFLRELEQEADDESALEDLASTL